MEELIEEIKMALEEMQQLAHPEREHPKEELEILLLAALCEEEQQ